MRAAAEETVGERLRRLRREQGLSQRELASEEVSAAHISRIEVGGRIPSTKTLRVLARRLRVRVSYLEHGTELTERELLELRILGAGLRVGLGGDEGDRLELLDAVSEAEALAEPVLVLEGKLCLAYGALSHEDYEAAGELLQSALRSRAASLSFDRGLHGVMAAIHWKLRSADTSNGTHGDAVGSGIFLGDVSSEAGLDEVARMKSCAEAALDEGKPHAALRALRAGIVALQAVAVGWAGTRTAAR